MAQPQPEKTLADLTKQYVVAGKSCIAFLNAQISTEELRDVLATARQLNCEQKDRAGYLELTRAGFEVRPQLQPPKVGFDICVIMAGKFRLLNEQMIARASSLVQINGTIIISGAKNIGISSLLKRTATIHEIKERLNKHHATAFAISNSKNLQGNFASVENYLIHSNNRTYKTAPGVFSAGKIDPGSALLVKHFDNKIDGSIADLGAGWGYLSGEAIAGSQNIKSIDLFEADWQGVELSKQNLIDKNNAVALKFHWHDIADEKIATKFNHVIMNPPFHQGRDTCLQLGQKFIATAWDILKPGGSLLMVANRQLSYEKTLGNLFRNFRILEETAEYKIISTNK